MPHIYSGYQRALYAYYTNLAMHNAAHIFNHITQILRLGDKIVGEDQLLTQNAAFFKLNSSSESTLHTSIINLLNTHLPFPGSIHKLPEDLAKCFSDFYQLLTDIRNHFSHYTEDDYDFLRNFQSIEKDLEKLKLFAFNDLERRHAIGEKTDDNKNVYKKFKSSMLVRLKQNKFSADELLFFIALFLKPREIYEMLNATPGKKNTAEQEKQWVRKFFTMLAVKRFHPKMKSDNPKEAIVLNILNDLAKPPKLIKNDLKPEMQNYLYTSHHVISTGDDVEEITVEKTRNGRNYSFMLLQYIDYFNLAPSFNFHINLGKIFVRKPYTKTIDGTNYTRILDKNIFAFGRLSKFTDDYFEGYVNRSEDGENTTFTEPLKFYSPKYHFSNNRIGFSIAKNTDEKGDQLKLTDYDGNQHFKIINLPPEFIISEAALPAMVFIISTYTESKVKTLLLKFKSSFLKLLEEIAKNKLDETEFRTLCAEKKLKPHWIPSKIKDYFEKSVPANSFQDNLKNSIDTQLDFISKLLDQLNLQPQKRDKTFKFSYKKGDLATFLARDIVKAMRTDDNNKKLSSLEYSILQSKMAYFEVQKAELQRLFHTFKIYEKHPFLKENIFDNVKMKNGKETEIGIKKFLKRYLYAKRIWLKSLLGKGEKEVNKFLNVTNHKTSEEELINYAKNLSVHPIYIPNDLFVDFLKDNMHINTDKPNTDYLIAQNTVEYGNQWFYDLYNLNELGAGKEKINRDKMMRRLILKDRILWKLVKSHPHDQHLKTLLEHQTLSEYKPNINILNQTLNITHKYKVRTKKVKLFEEIDGKEIMINANRKVKDYGFVKQILNDKRVNVILAYYIRSGYASLDFDKLEKELVFFEKFKISYIEKMQPIEKFMYSKNPNRTETPNFRSELESLNLVEEEVLNEIIEVRNALFHNQIPTLKVDEFIEGNLNQTIFSMMDDIYEKVNNAIN